ncbi:protein farnesyltransferase subunit beta [Agrilus planipennis]|uniref:Protein farnesyltransferase subunit beta n=1 Tax=Agrilus planipennis TaxID=224129 RepID=A0A1W4XHW9_AGRPL|nr:protein farnesyltransferase subunit beta [Agrilus planipennis]
MDASTFVNFLRRQKFNDEGVSSITSQEQMKVEEHIFSIYRDFSLRYELDKSLPKLLKWEHAKFLITSLSNLPGTYECLDASRTWMCYWILHALSLLNIKLPEDIKDAVIEFLKKCQQPDGGFGGGPGQYSHLATTYAAVNSLCIIGSQKAYDAIDREALQKFIWDLKSPDGSFRMHRNGEVDVRGAYCAISVATLTNIHTKELFEKTANWIVSCQTYEGGFSGYPGTEAHGGYTFCGIASLILLNKGCLCDSSALLRWLVNKQMKLEGGFQGRTNKLVDGCYSFWQGAIFSLVNVLINKNNVYHSCLLLSEEALQRYILVCCQHSGGGLLDKPGKPRDIYHTCYTLSGLSVAQHSKREANIVGSSENELAETHPLYNITPDMVLKALTYFGQLEIPNTKSNL